MNTPLPELNEQYISELKSPIVIQCPSPFYVQHVVQLLDWLEKAKLTSVVLCTDTPSLVQFLESLNFQYTTIHFLKSVKGIHLKNPFSVLKFTYEIHKGVSFFRNQLKNGTYIYFGLMGQLLGAAMLAHAAKSGTVIYLGCPEHDLRRNAPKGMKQELRLMLTQLITRCPHTYASRGTTHTYRDMIVHSEDSMPIERFSIELSPTLLKSYAYHALEHMDSGFNILFLERRGEQVYSDYKQVIESVCVIFRKYGGHINLKPHPRVGYSKFLDNCVESIVPGYIPAEFVDIDNFDLIVTNYSTAIRVAYLESKPGVVLEKMYQRFHPEDKDYTVNMLSNPDYFDGNTPPFYFPENLDELDDFMVKFTKSRTIAQKL